jgi:hypothetical protein
LGIVAYAPSAFHHCTHCEIVWSQTGFSRSVRAEQARPGLPDDLAHDDQASAIGRGGCFPATERPSS